MTTRLATSTLTLLAAAIPLLALSQAASDSAAIKLDRIVNEELDPGETVALSEDEINSFLRYGYAQELPEGVRDLKVRFQRDLGVVTGYADFSKLSSEGDSPARFLLMMLSGERAFDAQVRYTSARGMARVEIVSFKIDGREMKGPILDWAVDTFVSPNMEGFELGQPTPLSNGLEEIRLETGRAVVKAQETFSAR